MLPRWRAPSTENSAAANARMTMEEIAENGMGHQYSTSKAAGTRAALARVGGRGMGFQRKA
jgi:hypothetical protein